MSAWLRLLCGLEDDEETVAGVAQAEHTVTETVGSRECLSGVTLKADEQQWVYWVGYPLGVPALHGQTWSNRQWPTRTVIAPGALLYFEKVQVCSDGVSRRKSAGRRNIYGKSERDIHAVIVRLALRACISH